MAGLAGLSVIFVTFFVPELRARSIEEVDELFEVSTIQHRSSSSASSVGMAIRESGNAWYWCSYCTTGDGGCHVREQG